MKTIVVIGCLILSSQTAVRADMMVKEIRRTESYSIMGKTFPAKQESVTTWISKKAIRSKGTENDLLILSDQGTIYVIDHQEKKYRAMPDEMFTDSIKKQMDSVPPGMADKMQDMMKMEVTVTPTDQTTTINDWQCRKYTQTIKTGMGVTRSQLWATEQIDISPERMASFLTAFYKTGPMGKMSGNMVEEMKKIDGFVVKSTTEAEMMGAAIKSSSQVTQVEENASPPQNIYSLPQGYDEGQWE
ncbi:MAG: hypothetical protein ACOCW2_04755 [Chitinivibrionales bacterium]